MKIENSAQAHATTRWIERINKHIIDLRKMGRTTSLNLEDQLLVARRLKESLEASILIYSEDEKYGNPTEEKATTEDQTTGESGLFWDSTPEEPVSGGLDPAGEGNELEEEAEVADDLPSEDSGSFWPFKKNRVVEDSD